MQDKIQEIMGLVVQYGHATVALNDAKTNSDIAKELRKVDDIGVAIKDKLRELVREPLGDWDMWGVVCKDIDANEFSSYELNAMFEIGRNVERAHGITKEGGE